MASLAVSRSVRSAHPIDRLDEYDNTVEDDDDDSAHALRTMFQGAEEQVNNEQPLLAADIANLVDQQRLDDDHAMFDEFNAAMFGAFIAQAQQEPLVDAQQQPETETNVDAEAEQEREVNDNGATKSDSSDTLEMVGV